LSLEAVAPGVRPAESHGSRGTLAVPAPTRCDGWVALRRLVGQAREVLRASAGYEGAPRGIGLQHMARRGAALRAAGELGQHALEVMNAVLDSAHSGSRVEITSTVARPEAVGRQDVRLPT